MCVCVCVCVCVCGVRVMLQHDNYMMQTAIVSQWLCRKSLFLTVK